MGAIARRPGECTREGLRLPRLPHMLYLPPMEGL